MHRTALAILSLLAGSAVAGPLNPPAGPVAPTMKTMTEVEPRIAINATNTPGDANCVYKIVQRGSYYLTGNITGQSGKFAVQISADNVTLDLGGFAITGGAEGVYVQSASGTTRANVTVKNGSIAGCTSAGIDTTSADGGVLQNLTVQGCAAGGIYAGPQSRVEHCTADHTGNTGITAYFGSFVSDCQANYNAIAGFDPRNGCTIVDSMASYNTFRGIDGWAELTIRGCTVAHNGDNGIDTLDSCAIESCTVLSSTGDGIHVGSLCRVNSCRVQSSGNDGIFIVSGEVLNCSSCYNGSENGAGIDVWGSATTRVEDNTVTNQYWGILANAGYAMVVRNYVRGCPGGIIASGFVGPIYSSPGTISTGNPWANFVN